MRNFTEYTEGITVALFLLGFMHPAFFIVLAVFLILVIIFATSTPDNLPSTDSRHIDVATTNFRYMKQQYLQSPQWRSKRAQVLQRDGHSCRKCYSHSNLAVHHIQYSNLPNESLDDLVCLCEACHTAQHELHGYPQTYAEYMRWNQPIKG